MPSYQTELDKASKSAEKQVSQAEERIAETTRQLQNEWAKTFEEMSQTILSRARAEMELALKLSERLSAARSPSDALLAYQEWLTAEMGARSEAARQLMTYCQKFMTDSTRIFGRLN